MNRQRFKEEKLLAPNCAAIKAWSQDSKPGLSCKALLFSVICCITGCVVFCLLWKEEGTLRAGHRLPELRQRAKPETPLLASHTRREWKIGRLPLFLVGSSSYGTTPPEWLGICEWPLGPWCDTPRTFPKRMGLVQGPQVVWGHLVPHPVLLLPLPVFWRFWRPVKGCGPK